MATFFCESPAGRGSFRLVVNHLYYGTESPLLLEEAGETRQFDEELLVKALGNIYRKKFNIKTEIEPLLYGAISSIFHQAADEGFQPRTVADPDHDFYEQLRHSGDVFSAFKVHRAQNDMAARLIDSNGVLKPFNQWLKEVLPIASHQCGAWLRTEYDTAVIRAHQAADWQQFHREADVLPNLKWMPSTSVHPGEDHRRYWGTIRPIDDDFWNHHRPGDRWNCKCSLSSTDDPVTPVPVDDTEHTGGADGNKPQPGLKGNPGTTAQLFSDDHPYFPKSCKDCAFYKPGLKDRLKGLFHDRVKDCYHCPYIEGCLYGEQKHEVKEIKKEARELLQGNKITREDFGRDISISRRSIDEWTNQPHMHYAEKNRMILYIEQVLNTARYVGRKTDSSTKPGSKWIHLFETEIQGDKSWIIVKEYQDGTTILYSISDSPNILIGINEE